MIPLDQVVQVFRGPYFGPLAALMFAEKLPHRPMRGLAAIKRDGARQSALALECPTEKCFGGGNIPLGAEQFAREFTAVTSPWLIGRGC
ncbi:protein of unknown function (plasmid) [Methylocella tundrae]|uniref:Uncharacterized protein n=1 Tax=Methylocella tundrae TaxID=227605 RepID=A0A4U8Z725_METTU|nr:protein of unknown function [Methylocella tundrae]